jgi:hypothetical protein
MSAKPRSGLPNQKPPSCSVSRGHSHPISLLASRKRVQFEPPILESDIARLTDLANTLSERRSTKADKQLRPVARFLPRGDPLSPRAGLPLALVREQGGQYRQQGIASICPPSHRTFLSLYTRFVAGGDVDHLESSRCYFPRVASTGRPPRPSSPLVERYGILSAGNAS